MEVNYKIPGEIGKQCIDCINFQSSGHDNTGTCMGYPVQSDAGCNLFERKQTSTANQYFTYNTIGESHEEVETIEKVIKTHIGWAVNGKDRKTLFSTVIQNDELFFFQPDKNDTVKGITQFTKLVDEVFMPDDFTAIKTEINELHIHVSKSLKTAWFSCILNDYNEYKGEPFVWENIRWTGVLEKIDDNWKIFQMHFSKPE